MGSRTTLPPKETWKVRDEEAGNKFLETFITWPWKKNDETLPPNQLQQEKQPEENGSPGLEENTMKALGSSDRHGQGRDSLQGVMVQDKDEPWKLPHRRASDVGGAALFHRLHPMKKKQEHRQGKRTRPRPMTHVNSRKGRGERRQSRGGGGLKKDPSWKPEHGRTELPTRRRTWASQQIRRAPCYHRAMGDVKDV